eukprot:6334945-Pyramimonas_sp.AAC.1
MEPARLTSGPAGSFPTVGCLGHHGRRRLRPQNRRRCTFDAAASSTRHQQAQKQTQHKDEEGANGWREGGGRVDG